MRLRTWSLLVVLSLAATTSVSAGWQGSVDGVAIAQGEAAPFDGILITREAFDELLAEAEAGEIRRRQVEAAISWAESRGDRIEQLEAQLGRRKWVNRVLGVGCGTMAYFLGRETGKNSASRSTFGSQ